MQRRTECINIIINIMGTVKVLNINIQNITRQELLENLKEGVLVTPNLDHLIKLQKDTEFYDVYQKSEWVVCDSKILYLFGKLLKTPIKEAIPGSSFFTSIICIIRMMQTARSSCLVLRRVLQPRLWNASMRR